MKLLGSVAVLVVMFVALPPAHSQLKKDRGVRDLMVNKLKHSQLVLEGMALGDFAKITQSAEKLLQLSRQAEWFVYRTPRFEMQTNEFRRAAEAVVQKAADKNLDGVAVSYFEMTLACIRCHQHVRDIRDARLPAPEWRLAHAAEARRAAAR